VRTEEVELSEPTSAASFAAWVRPHWPHMDRLALRLVGTAPAEDVVQDALAAAWRSWARFDSERGQPRAWLLAIVANKARDQLRRNRVPMTDLEDVLRADAERWSGRLRPVPDLDDQLASALSRRSQPRRLLLPLLAAAAVVAAVVGVAVLSRPRDHRSVSSGALAPITGVVWKDLRSAVTVVFTNNTMRLFDGCDGELDRLRVTDGSLVQGHRIGEGFGCSPNAAGPGYRAQQRRLNHFYAVIAGPAAWSRSGDVLTLTTPGKGTLHLTTGGARPRMLVGTSWRLTYFSGPDEYEHPAAKPLELIVDPSGSFTAGLGCGALVGTAGVSPQSIRFTDVSPPPPGCASTLDAAGRVVFELVTAGRASYVIRGNQLIVHSKGEMLVYAP
jgi:DNA-directed RNA polymerase specialized sigma24 family protein